MMASSKLKKRLLFPIAGLFIGSLPILGLELVLRGFNIAAPETVVDRSFGFGPYQPLFVLTKDQTQLRTSQNKALYFGTQRFTPEKRETDYRMFFLGGSTVRGRPFTVATAFAKWVELELNARSHNGTTYQSINCGGLSYASYRLARINQEILQYDPNLVVLATGHNEFLEDRSFTTAKTNQQDLTPVSSWRSVNWIRSLAGDDLESFKTSSEKPLPTNVTARLDAKSGYASYQWAPTWKRDVIAQYRESVTGIIRQCQTKNIPILLVCLGSNLRDCPPIKSELPLMLSNATRQKWLNLFDQATRHRGDPATALELFRQCATITDDHALLHYRMARCFEQLGQMQPARDHYLLAKDHDICPLRLTEQMDHIIHELADRFDVPMVDVRQTLEQASAQQIPGYEMYIDHVHPSIAGHQLIATTIVKQLINSKLVTHQHDFLTPDYTRMYQTHLQERPPSYFSNGLRRVQWLENWARRDHHQQELTPFDLRGRLAKADRLLGFGELDRVTTELTKALNQYPTAYAAIVEMALQRRHHGDDYHANFVLSWLNTHGDPIEQPDTNQAVSVFRY
jgi:lysophospholipase L1-like esterase